MDWPIANSGSRAFNAVAASNGYTNVPVAATINTKSAWVQIVASTAEDATGVILHLATNVAGGRIAVDIAIGAPGSETIVIADVYFNSSATTFISGQYYFPVRIKAGTRIAARTQNIVTTNSVFVSAVLVNDLRHVAGPLETVGFVPASTTGTVVDAGATANTKGAYSIITSATVRDWQGFYMYVGVHTDVARTSASYAMDIAIGASNQIIVPSLLFAVNSTIDALMPGLIYVPIPIKAGTRISARMESTTATAGDRTLDVVIYGVTK